MTINWSPKRDRGLINWAPKVAGGGAPVFVTTALPQAFVGVPYSAQIEATGEPTITFAVAGGELPAGLSLSASGLISGTPTGSASATFVIEATNGVGPAQVTLTIEGQPAPALQTVTLTPSVVALKIGESVDLQATAKDQYGNPISGLSGTALSAPGSVASASMVGMTDDSGRVLVRVTALTAGTVSIVAKFGEVMSEPSVMTVTARVVAFLAGAANASIAAVANLSLSVVKGVRIRLHTKANVPRSNISGIQVRWWDDALAATTYVGVGAIDSGGWIAVNLDAVTALPVGGAGRIELFKQGATFREDMYFAGRLPVVDIGAAQ